MKTRARRLTGLVRRPATGEPSIAPTLALAAIPIWMRFARFEECWRLIGRALVVARPGSREELELSIARKDVELGIKPASDTGPVGDLAAAQEVLERARLGARRLEDPQLELRATWVLWNFYMSCARVRLAQAEMVHFGRLAAREGTPFQRLVAQHMTGVTELLAGETSRLGRSSTVCAP